MASTVPAKREVGLSDFLISEAIKPRSPEKLTILLKPGSIMIWAGDVVVLDLAGVEEVELHRAAA